MRQIQVDVGPEYCSRANEQGKQRDDDPTTIFAPPQPPLGPTPLLGVLPEDVTLDHAAQLAKWHVPHLPSSTRRPTAKLVRQVLGAISEFDKAMTVAKLRGARERKRREAGKCEGRKSHAERNPELVALAKRLHRQKPKGGRMSLRAISAELAAQGFLNENGRPFAAASIKSMLN
jgi:hypothetical protein